MKAPEILEKSRGAARHLIRLMVFHPVREEILRWIEPNDTGSS